MDELQSSVVLTALFALRCVAPFAFTLAIGYLMNRLVDRWQAEEEAERRAVREEQRPETVMPSDGSRLPVRTLPCWLLKRCDETKRANCPAPKQPGLPCWLVKMRAEGVLPDDCPDCPIYSDAGIAMA